MRVTEAGVYFRTLPPEENPPEATDEGKEMYLDAEISVKIQEQLGADIVAAFDEPTSPAHDYAHTKQAMERTHKWAERSIEARTTDQAMYGVVQGGAFEDLRSESARVIGGMPFEGFAIGSTYGDAYGGTKSKTAQMVSWAINNLPKDRPRHLFGVGKIEDILAGVEAGIDTFDCVIPTREARHGRIWTERGHLDITRSVLPDMDGPLDEMCLCPVCADPDMSRSELKKLFKDKNLQAGRLATIHNVFLFNNFMVRLRQAINDGQFMEFKKEALAKLKK
ncbi:MAG: tRNA guanosine(34) transglycosylase Tgt [Candidatus Liptonbacteria bacterium]